MQADIANDLTKMQHITQGLDHALNSLLQLSVLEANDQQTAPCGTVSLHALFNELEENFSYLAQQKKLKLRFISNNLYVHSHAFQLKRLLQNLIQNALRYTSKGHVLIAVRQQRDDLPITIEVRDTGMGIATKDRNKIFDLFYQAQPSSDKTQNGLGLGLAIVERLLRQLPEHQLRLKSQRPRGSCFILILPIATPPYLSPSSSYYLPHIIWLNSETKPSDGFINKLKGWEFHVTEVYQINEILQQKMHPPDIIICDAVLLMPAFIKPIERIRAYFELPTLPVVLLVMPDANEFVIPQSYLETVCVVKKDKPPLVLRSVLDHLVE